MAEKEGRAEQRQVKPGDGLGAKAVAGAPVAGGGVVVEVREKKGPLRAAIPTMPFPLAVICLFLNTFIPGLGKSLIKLGPLLYVWFVWKNSPDKMGKSWEWRGQAEVPDTNQSERVLSGPGCKIYKNIGRNKPKLLPPLDFLLLLQHNKLPGAWWGERFFASCRNQLLCSYLLHACTNAGKWQ